MSATAPLRTPSPQRAPQRVGRVAAAPRPRQSRAPAASPPLRLVEAPATARGRIAFVVLVGAVLGGGLVVLLLLHTLAAQDAFRLHRLQHETATLADTEQQLTVANQQAAAPSLLARRARALGMVPTGQMTIVRRRDGRIVGVATAAYVPPPAPAASPSTSPSAAPTAGAKPTAAPSTGTASTGTGSTGAKPAPAHRHKPRRH